MATAKKKPAPAPALKSEVPTLIPLNKLVISPLNVRKTGGQSIEDLAANILAHNLLQNLTVVAQVNAKGKPTGIYEVTAGGRRLRAFNLLAKQGKIKPDHKVPCLVKPVEEALASSLSENTMREAMHAADQFAAFEQTIAGGKTVEETAAEYGVTPQVVERRLRLANCSARLMKAFRADELSLDAMMAYAVTPDTKRQDQVFRELTERGAQNNADIIRRHIVNQQIDSTADPRVALVGLEAYRAAGGPLTLDLFSDNGRCYLQDEALLDSLVDQKLSAEADMLRAAGWSWVEVHRNLRVDVETAQHTRLKWGTRKPTAEEKREIDALKTELDSLTKALMAAEQGTPYNHARVQELDDQISEAEGHLAYLQDGLETYTDEQRAEAGAIVTIHSCGKVLRVLRGMVKRAPKEEPRPARRGSQSAAGGQDAGGAQAADDALPAALTLDLQRTLTVAVQDAVRQSPHVALVSIVHTLVQDIFEGDASHDERLVKIFTHGSSVLDFEDEAYECAAGKALEEAHREWYATLGEKIGEPDGLFAELAGWPQDRLLLLLAYCVARRVHGVPTDRGDDASTSITLLARAVNLDMARCWHPTRDNYFARVAKPRIQRDVAEACGPDAARQIASLAKDAAAQRAEELLQANVAAGGKPWLPRVLRVAEIAEQC